MEEEAAGGGTAAETDVEKDDDERELEKLEKNDPEMLRICTIIIEQLDKFKVRLFVIITKLRVVTSLCLFNNFFAVINFALA